MSSSKLLISREDIARKVDELAGRIAADFQGTKPVIIGVLNGSYVFMADLTRALWEKGLADVEIEFVAVSSYGMGKESSRAPKLTKDLKTDIGGKDVLIVEDIIDTGHTLSYVHGILSAQNPKQLKSVALLSKPEKKEVDFTPDYIGFEVEGSKWVEGYGLDSEKYGRGCPDILEIIS